VNARERLRRLSTAIDALTLRERLMVFACLLVVTIWLWNALLLGPLDARETLVSQEIARSQQRLTQMNEAMTLAAEGIGDGLGGQADRRLALQRQLDATEETVRVFTSDLVDPSQMRHVLEELIRKQRGLTLIRASNLEVRPLIEADAEEPTQEPMLYRHGLRLEVQGSYLDCIAYLEAVERLPWRFYWGGLRLEAHDYPTNTIAVEIFTLSLDEDWIGV
jgi:MSHA biogenesis protein MshJ